MDYPTHAYRLQVRAWPAYLHMLASQRLYAMLANAANFCAMVLPAHTGCNCRMAIKSSIIAQPVHSLCTWCDPACAPTGTHCNLRMCGSCLRLTACPLLRHPLAATGQTRPRSQEVHHWYVLWPLVEPVCTHGQRSKLSCFQYCSRVKTLPSRALLHSCRMHSHSYQSSIFQWCAL